jgi:hypothetical protein
MRQDGSPPSPAEIGRLRSILESELLIHPLFAEIYSVFFGLFFLFEQLALYSLHLANRSELAPFVDNAD